MATRFILIVVVGLILTLVIVTAPDGAMDPREAGAAEVSAEEVKRMQDLERQAVAQSLAQAPKANIKPVEAPDEKKGAPVSPKPVSAQVSTPKPKPKVRTVTVRNGDNLSAIAKRVYKNPNKWRLIYEANRSKLKTPDALKVGMVLTVPEHTPQ